MHVTVRPLDAASEPDVDASYRIQAAAAGRDVPDLPPRSVVDHRGQYRYPWPGRPQFHWLAEADGETVGTLDITLHTLDNLHLAEAELIVHPDHRRRGVGRALYAHAVDFARGRGRRVLTTGYVSQLPGGPPRDPAHAAFAEAMGVKAASTGVRRRLDLDQVDAESWDRLYADSLPRAEGYSMVRWTGSSPEAYVADLAALDSRIMLDAPMGDLEYEPFKVDVARIRATDETERARGMRSYHAGMRHDASGRIVAWTAINFDAEATGHAWQGITIVDPVHRGHRLGLLIKIENLRHVRQHEPALRLIDTWNSAENTYMIAINDTLSFRRLTPGWTASRRSESLVGSPNRAPHSG